VKETLSTNFGKIGRTIAELSCPKIKSIRGKHPSSLTTGSDYLLIATGSDYLLITTGSDYLLITTGSDYLLITTDSD
jgi:hypothetical protein